MIAGAIVGIIFMGSILGLVLLGIYWGRK